MVPENKETLEKARVAAKKNEDSKLVTMAGLTDNPLRYESLINSYPERVVRNPFRFFREVFDNFHREYQKGSGLK